MSYSNSGGTITLPSPTHVRHIDVTNAVRSLRRSMTRSPSKFSLHQSPSSSPKAPLSPSPNSPSKLSPSSFGATTPSPLAKPFPPSRLSLRSAIRSRTTTPLTGSKRTSPRSPQKRVLSESMTRNNTQPKMKPYPKLGDNEDIQPNIVPFERISFEDAHKDFMFGLDGGAQTPTPAALQRPFFSRVESADNVNPSISSPLKRTDSSMNLDKTFGTPLAKRRSVHGSASFGSEFNIFDHPPSTSTPQFDIHEDSPMAEKPSMAFTANFGSDKAVPFTGGGGGSGSSSSGNTSTARRASSLRKSTLKQRSSWGRKNHPLSQDQSSTPQKANNRPSISRDQFDPLPPGSPFAPPQGPLPNPSMHMMSNAPQPQIAQKQHPLANFLTNSSSNSSIEESPRRQPLFQVPKQEDPRPKLDFSKSLPAGALRPRVLENLKSQACGSNEFSTPDSFKSAKPHAAAFASTGLISKVNHNPEQAPAKMRGSLRKSIMPDTPCKKPAGGFNTMPAPASNVVNKFKHSFGTPSTPFSFTPNVSKIPFGKGSNVFGGNNETRDRRGSFLSINGDDGSSDNIFDSHSSSAGDDMPPTPTKGGMMGLEVADGSPSNMRNHPFTMFGGSINKPHRTSSKLCHSTISYETDKEDEVDFAGQNSPTPAAFRMSKRLEGSMSSFSRSRFSKQGMSSGSPAPLGNGASKKSRYLSSPSPLSTKNMPFAVDSQMDIVEVQEAKSPHTPQVDNFAEDTSRLSISGHRMSIPFERRISSNLAPPATPTTNNAAVFNGGGVTPVHNSFPTDVDEHLQSRFDKVEMIGTGEFSNVYRVSKAQNLFPGNPSFNFGTPASQRTPPSPLPVSIYAVKKARTQYTGPKDRQRKLHEVNVMKALGQNDHIVNYVDDWEYDDFLYIQMEFCEEGSLDSFLSQVGRKGRLDDFRIWKIMLELGEGLRHIHHSGFIHLDLKPANVFITFEGILKIGDFGMASTYPVPPGIEGEGDREYIGPEILQGKYDTPADIFAFGLIMLETAANVQLPDNGPTWHRLRSGDMSDVPSLTWSNASSIARDANGMPTTGEEDSDTDMACFESDDEMEEKLPPGQGRKRNYNPTKRSTSHDPANLFGSIRRGELTKAPAFMTDMYDESSLDKLVKWMLTPEPEHRPTIDQIMEHEGVQWVQRRSRAGATVFEGSWGPADDVLAIASGDAEMIDV